ncbi:MAG: guanylate kinase [Clostridia bacterium]|nr:guanylate kinase [Clostridia bacterium]
MRKGLLFIISGPAGSGKGTVVNRLLSAHPELKLSISATTRQPRPGEVDGVHYYYISKDEFEERIASGKMLEYTTYSGNYYGTPEKEVRQALENGQDIILEIEVDGAMQIKERIEGAVAIMLTPPNSQVLEARLRGRGTETDEVIKWRLARAKEEVKLLPKYDYLVINEDNRSDECAQMVYSIILAEHQKSIHNRSIIEKFI